MNPHPSGDKRFKLLDAAMKKHQFQADALGSVAHRAGVVRVLAGRLADLHCPPAQAAAEPGVWGGDVLSFFHVHAEGEAQFQRLPGDGRLCERGGGGADALEEELGVNAGQTRGDGLASMAIARCLGACGLAAGRGFRRRPSSAI